MSESLRSRIAGVFHIAPGRELRVVRAAVIVMVLSYWTLWTFESGYLYAQVSLSNGSFVGPVGYDSFYRWAEGVILVCFSAIAIALWTRSAAGFLVSLLANLGIFLVFGRWYVATQHFLKFTLELKSEQPAYAARVREVGWFFGASWLDYVAFWFALALIAWFIAQLIVSIRKGARAV